VLRAKGSNYFQAGFKRAVGDRFRSGKSNRTLRRYGANNSRYALIDPDMPQEGVKACPELLAGNNYISMPRASNAGMAKATVTHGGLSKVESHRNAHPSPGNEIYLNQKCKPYE